MVRPTQFPRQAGLSRRSSTERDKVIPSHFCPHCRITPKPAQRRINDPSNFQSEQSRAAAAVGTVGLLCNILYLTLFRVVMQVICEVQGAMSDISMPTGLQNNDTMIRSCWFRISFISVKYGEIKDGMMKNGGELEM